MTIQAVMSFTDLQDWLKTHHIKLTMRWLGTCGKVELVATSSLKPTMRFRVVEPTMLQAFAYLCTQVKERLKSHAD